LRFRRSGSYANYGTFNSLRETRTVAVTHVDASPTGSAFAGATFEAQIDTGQNDTDCLGPAIRNIEAFDTAESTDKRCVTDTRGTLRVVCTRASRPRLGAVVEIESALGIVARFVTESVARPAGLAPCCARYRGDLGAVV